MKSHQKPPKVPKAYSCSHCDAKFKRKFNLKVHETVHTGEKPLKCDKCNLGFALRSRLKKHMKIHLGYPCKECDFKAEHWSGLRQHMVQHRQQCPKCCKKFATTATLQSHLIKHEEVFKCPHCPRSYNRTSNLQAHVRAVHENILFSCNECSKKFSFKKSLVEHYKKKHVSDSLEPKSNKPTVTKKRKLTSLLLSACDEVPLEEREELLENDKRFRRENPEWK